MEEKHKRGEVYTYIYTKAIEIKINILEDWALKYKWTMGEPKSFAIINSVINGFVKRCTCLRRIV